MLVQKYNKVSRLAFRFGMLGIFGQVLGLALSIALFEQFDGSGFNFLNHTLSELGNYGHSQYAVVMNGGLFFGSLCVVLFCLLSLQLGESSWRFPFYISLGLSYFSFAAMGLFPINVYHLHVIAIKYFFVFTCCSLLFYGCFLVADREVRFSLGSKISGLLALIIMSAFLFLPWLELGFTEGNEAFYNEMLVKSSRPELWWPAVIMWAGLATYLLWTVLVIKGVKNNYYY